MSAALKRILETPLDIDVRGGSCRVVVAADKYTIANISTGANDREAYARLFASAPAMLEALQAIIDMNVRYAINRYGDAAEAESLACVTTARAAIAKATGAV
jgi:hypothetical protein